MATSATRNENRLSDDDRSRMTTTLDQVLVGWPSMPSEAYVTLERIAAHAIGCSVFDLRDSEMDEVGDLVAAAVTRRQFRQHGGTGR